MAAPAPTGMPRWRAGALTISNGERAWCFSLEKSAGPIRHPPGTTGLPDEAVICIQRAVDAGLQDVAWLQYCPLITPLRGRAELVAAETTVADRARAVLDNLRTGSR